VRDVLDVLEEFGDTIDKNGARLRYKGCDQTTLNMWGFTNNCGN
jgi:hypothetical protein